MTHDNDTLFAMLFLGRISRDAVKYDETPRGKEPDHTWSSFKKMDQSFRAKYPDLAPALNSFMKSEKDKWGDLFGELFKQRSLAVFVTTNNIL